MAATAAKSVHKGGKGMLYVGVAIMLWTPWFLWWLSSVPVPPPVETVSPAGPTDAVTVAPLPVDTAVVVSVSETSVRYPITSARFANGAANRSPHRRRQPLFGRSEAEVEQGAAKHYVSPSATTPLSFPADDARCWDRVGEPTAIPKWTVALFGQLPSRQHYDIIANETDEDRWGVLVAWVPSRFMPPQKDGKNAAGRIIKPPTRGRDPNYYLKEYNATWHSQAEVAGMQYHFQLLHRNALAVCIRERLHVTALRCTPHPTVPPALLHHCLCRHCSEPTHHPFPKPTTRIPGFSSDFTWKALYSMPRRLIEETPFLQRRAKLIPALPKTTASRPGFTGTCVQARSAPWLVPNTTVEAFPYEGLHADLPRLLRTQADSSNVVMMSIFNEFWIDHLHNFYFSMVRRAALTNIVIATMDIESLRICLANRLPCFDATRYAEYEEDMDAGGDGRKKGSLRKVTEAMSWIKPRLAKAVIEEGYGFFMIDLDMSWNAWPMKEVLDPGTDLTHQCDAAMQTSINSGYYLARPSPRTWLYFENLMLFRPEENSDQTAMKLFVRYDHTHGVSNTCLDKWAFNMKCNYKRAGSVKKGPNNTETFEWVPFDRNRKNFLWKILHATCIGGALPKMKYLRTMNAWFLDDLDKMTESRKYCFTLEDGTTRDGDAITVHSRDYVTTGDDAFLKARH